MDKNSKDVAVETQKLSDFLKAIEGGVITSSELIESHLRHIAENKKLGVWAHLDEELARLQGKHADDFRSKGYPIGPLHGIPIGLKDIIDTQDMPTAYGSHIFNGHYPESDAHIVSLLKEAGAIIMGKTVTTEFAYLKPSLTLNPHNHNHTPGGSSSGSAAAVASGMVPVAIGTQTNGSVIRPASYCGVYAFKPTLGRISRHGVLSTSQRLDTVGIFGQCLEDIATVADVLISYDQKDVSMILKPKPQILNVMNVSNGINPKFAFVKTPVWDKADEETKEGFSQLINLLGDQVEEIELPSIFAKAHDALSVIMSYEISKNFSKTYANNKSDISSYMSAVIEKGQQIITSEYDQAIQVIFDLRYILNELFEDFDAILTPSAAGEAPQDLDTTGDPAFCSIWSLCGTPCLNLPILEGANSLPIGVQMVSNLDDDARLFRTAKWLIDMLQNEDT